MLRFTGAQPRPHRHPGAAIPPAGLITELRPGPASRAVRFPPPPWSSVPDLCANPLVTKFEQLARLDRDDIEALNAVSRNPRRYQAEKIIVDQGVAAHHVSLLLDGLAFRYKILAGGRRQILGYVVPGDLCDAHFTLFNQPDHCIALVSDAAVVNIPIATFARMMDRHPQVARAASLAALIDGAILREWLLNVGQRDAFQRMSHFFCEMAVRLTAVGQIGDDGSFDLPLSQATLADTVGMSPVHTNRILQRLRNDGLIALRQRRLTILDPARLVAVAGFEDNYLRLRGDQDQQAGAQPCRIG